MFHFIHKSFVESEILKLAEMLKSSKNNAPTQASKTQRTAAAAASDHFDMSVDDVEFMDEDESIGEF